MKVNKTLFLFLVVAWVVIFAIAVSGQEKSEMTYKDLFIGDWQDSFDAGGNKLRIVFPHHFIE